MGSSIDTDEEKLSMLQQKFLAARQIANTDLEVARSIGISNQTVSDWKREIPAFRRAYDNIGRSAIEIGKRALQDALPKAIRVLEAALESPSERNRIKAAEGIMAYAGLSRGVEINIHTMDRTRELLDSIRQAKEQAQLPEPSSMMISGDVIDGEIVEMDAEMPVSDTSREENT